VGSVEAAMMETSRAVAAVPFTIFTMLPALLVSFEEMVVASVK
jgi:hypothetical protein